MSRLIQHFLDADLGTSGRRPHPRIGRYTAISNNVGAVKNFFPFDPLSFLMDTGFRAARSSQGRASRRGAANP